MVEEPAENDYICSNRGIRKFWELLITNLKWIYLKTKWQIHISGYFALNDWIRLKHGIGVFGSRSLRICDTNVQKQTGESNIVEQSAEKIEFSRNVVKVMGDSEVALQIWLYILKIVFMYVVR